MCVGFENTENTLMRHAAANRMADSTCRKNYEIMFIGPVKDLSQFNSS